MYTENSGKWLDMQTTYKDPDDNNNTANLSKILKRTKYHIFAKIHSVLVKHKGSFWGLLSSRPSRCFQAFLDFRHNF